MLRRILGIVVVVIVLVYIAGFFRTTEINTSIKIDAPPDQVWEVLTNLAAYKEWNPFMTQASGRVTKDAHLRITIAPVGDEDAMLFQPTVLTVEENEQLTWRGRVLIPGILDGTHSFALEETGDGGTELTHSESFRGVMLFVNDMSVYEPSFVAMNEALKVRAEAVAGAEPAAREVPSGPIQPDVGVIFNMTGGHERLSGEAVAEPEATTEEGTMEEGTSGDGAMMESTTEEGAMMEGEATMEPETPADSGSSGGSGNLFDVGRDTPSTPPMESGSNPR